MTQVASLKEHGARRGNVVWKKNAIDGRCKVERRRVDTGCIAERPWGKRWGTGDDRQDIAERL